MHKKLLFIILPILLIGFLKTARPVQAEIVVFRITRDDPTKGTCNPMSLTENMTTRVVGNTGAGCNFQLETTVTGEWVTAGDYFDTPPYAWGADTYYNGGGAADFSFTCNQPTYDFGDTDLPSYVTLTREETITGTGTTVPVGKRYFFSVSNSAPANSSFNANVYFETDCTMKKTGTDESGPMTPVRQTSNACGSLPVIDINPRKENFQIPITIGTSCAPTSTPRPTATSTPVPSRTPTKTPTPTPLPQCNGPCVPSDNQCPQQCPLCVSVGGNFKCQAPSPTPTRTPTKTPTKTPTPTPPPSCNGPCVVADNLCPQECPICKPTNGGNGVCAAPTSTPTPTPPPSCGEICVPSDNQCPELCPLCIPSGGVSRCVAPTRTPTPTPPPVCNGPCVVADNLCPQECPVCVPSGSAGQGICAAPTATPTPPPVCNGPCVVNDNKCPIECPLCVSSGSGGNGTCAAPTATPTLTPTITPTPPPVCAGPCIPNQDTCPIDCPACAPSSTGGGTVCRIPASCNCDGFEYTGNLAKGETVTFTGFSKVENPDSNDAKTLHMVFHVEANGVEIANSGPIAVDGPERTTDSAGIPIDRYKASWAYTIPADGSGEVTYRAFVSITCTYKNQGQANTQSVGQTGQQPNLIQRFFNFVLSIFGRQPQIPIVKLQSSSNNLDFTFEATDPPYWTPASPIATVTEVETLKLGTFTFNPTPTPIVELGCKQVLFKINY